MDDFWKFLKGVFYCIMFAPLVIGLLMIATGNGKSSNDSSSSPSYTPASPIPVTNYARSDEQLREMINSIPNDYTPINIQRVTSGAPTPDDAYSEGYDEGYEQGRRDGANGHSHGYGYDDSSSYYDYYETRYQEGYEEGYDDGYSAGQSEYEEEQDEEEDW